MACGFNRVAQCSRSLPKLLSAAVHLHVSMPLTLSYVTPHMAEPHLAVMVLLVVPLDDSCDVEPVHVVPVLIKSVAREATAHQLHRIHARS